MNNKGRVGQWIPEGKLEKKEPHDRLSLRVCSIVRRENKKKEVVDHLDERNNEGERCPLSYVGWCIILLIISPIYERSKLRYLEGF